MPAGVLPALRASKRPWNPCSSREHIDWLTGQGPDPHCTFEAWRAQSEASDAAGG